ncbi:MAG: 23S rRNA pseudouridine(1911/1915/1917) synthase RluD, partial [Gammaproteobacteria bacterium]|nr:23S rRNA pseudouridine(1911/1915/1917) synthase RluD [Gammaproteobacteria bacterium]
MRGVQNPVAERARGEVLSARIPEALAGARLDQALARLFPQYSRSQLTRWVREGRVRLEARPAAPSDRVRGGERVEVAPRLEPVGRCAPQALALDVVYEDAALLVVNKPPGLVVHPAAGHHEGTLQNALLHHDPELERLPRAGIVHRLDKDTSGLLVVARTPAARAALVEALQARAVEREYLALVHGAVIAGGTIEGPIGRHPVDRKRMAVTPKGRPAVTHYRVAERFRDHTLLRVRLETGRTHQIRVHMAQMRHPILGDPLYGGRPRPPKGAGEGLRRALREFRRQALHAARLVLAHPVSGERMSWEAPLPED